MDITTILTLQRIDATVRAQFPERSDDNLEARLELTSRLAADAWKAGELQRVG